MADPNPFDELELDPRLNPEELTEALRRRAERADGAERLRIQELWRTLTVNERDRVRWAFFAHPRASDADPAAVEALREKVPPVIARGKKRTIDPLVEDALVFEQPNPKEAKLLPPSLFGSSGEGPFG